MICQRFRKKKQSGTYRSAWPLAKTSIRAILAFQTPHISGSLS